MAYPTNVDAKIALLEAQLEADLATGLNSSVTEILEKLKNIRQSSSSGGGGASATDIGDAVNGTPITGQTLEAGGDGGTGWLSSLRKAITDRLPSSLGAKTGATSFSVVPASDGFATTNTGVGLPADSAATSDAGTFSLVALTKRQQLKRNVVLINLRTTLTASGDTPLVAAPGTGLQFAIRRFRIQNLDDITRTILLKAGSGTTLAGTTATIIGSGVSEIYDESNEIILPENTALVYNLSIAGSVATSIGYYVRTVATGLPA